MKKTIILGLALSLIISGCSLGNKQKNKDITLEEARVLTAKFINENLMQAGKEVSIKEATEDGGMYKIIVNIPGGQDGAGQEIESYLSKDGKKFFPSVMDIEEIAKKTKENQQQQTATQAQTAATVAKAQKPKVELFVMSHCPYGTQIEKGIIPAIEKLGDNVDFVLEFCDYAMHGKKELDEQLVQHCIQKNEKDKLFTYLKCFLEAGDGEGCLTTAKINKTKLNSCVTATDKEFKVTELFNDKSTWSGGQFPQFNVYKEAANRYGVQGSPGLVINGVKVQSGRDSASLLKVICSGFENAPKECEDVLSSASPSPGFGFNTTDAAANGGCGG
ncbi:hypothetical protein A2331_06015 [Candidatus Falkowbacteria bacterium RIFOXYB2_FULL_34_18]|uniref:Thioredoxin-like fold domain-containing protein n=1 Tax=Candidatus Falkowbacteria bacterium RIFOXYD2_FULL_34_120 TaxID=1798007 RepID=A0A1F5TP14_9BACT|nr:MAG: hypothetical protein A2331_06015 [Candidatus Falkowbacteria bacterium RIFOXYB2_FULL_34_18]OGF29057.1 MAG: hypothetical protein A2500_03380 [Candidatus Falkowbacteria bacterium RIFOXYC12_FULL_34_55]OGF36133.1 MAG: hypothetical protein A2466_03590 [Candidatus Falkowbacteria bacterium RIFOXYC2_FULL_34_220]OGF38585.1 MAG: hypothetical protein A2515_04850 [Candidatus Falkowbacteria bacterium RIFOXYD12_FULL_34_57]OGF40742.1 MAG: hypothetical protein A2531_06905 [Candidatus Falkowbacteria bact